MAAGWLPGGGWGRQGAGGKRKPQTSDEILGGERVAVRPSQARPEAEHIRESAVVDRPGPGRPGDDRAVGRLHCHALVKIGGYRDGRVVLGQLWVQSCRIDAQATVQRGGGTLGQPRRSVLIP